MSAFILANASPPSGAGWDPDPPRDVEEAVERHGGHVLVWGGAAEPVDQAGLPLGQVVLTRFDSADAARGYAAADDGWGVLAGHVGAAPIAAVLLQGTDQDPASPDAPGYVLADTVIDDPQVHLAGWLPRGRPLHRSHGGRIIGVSSPRTLSRSPQDLAADDRPERLVGEWSLGRVLLNEFPDLQHARDFVTSATFVEGARVRAEAGTYRFAVLHGRSPRAAAAT